MAADEKPVVLPDWSGKHTRIAYQLMIVAVLVFLHAWYGLRQTESSILPFKVDGLPTNTVAWALTAIYLYLLSRFVIRSLSEWGIMADVFGLPQKSIEDAQGLVDQVRTQLDSYDTANLLSGLDDLASRLQAVRPSYGEQPVEVYFPRGIPDASPLLRKIDDEIAKIVRHPGLLEDGPSDFLESFQRYLMDIQEALTGIKAVADRLPDAVATVKSEATDHQAVLDEIGKAVPQIEARLADARRFFSEELRDMRERFRKDAEEALSPFSSGLRVVQSYRDFTFSERWLYGVWVPVVVSLGLILCAGWAAARTVDATPSLALCSGTTIATCVVDGDTVRIDGKRIRLADVDAPEPTGRCVGERILAAKAAGRLAELLAPGDYDIVPGDPSDGRLTDRYGRALAVISVDGVSVGATLVQEGLARPWRGARENWC